jgi:hypothetical protein
MGGRFFTLGGPIEHMDPAEQLSYRPRPDFNSQTETRPNRTQNPAMSR